MNSQPNTAVAKQYERVLEAEAAARKQWDRQHREVKKLARLAKLGRKKQVEVAISENRAIRITNQYRTKDDKIFVPAFCRRFELKEVSLDSD